MNPNRRIVAFHAVVLIAIWAQIVLSVYKTRGLFDWLGVDYALYSAGAKLVVSDDPAAVYDIKAVARESEPFAAYYGPKADPLKIGPLPYPLPSFLYYAPFATLTPPVGYGLWVLVNLGLAAFVIRGLTARLPGGPSWALTALLLTYFPLVYTLFVGQPVVLMLLSLAMAYRSWERGRDFEAGLWCGGLFLKVQYPLFLVLVLIYKRRWRSLAGVATSALTIFLSSLAVFGWRGAMAFAATLRSMSGFRSVQSIIYPHQMINWRGLLVNLLPTGVSESQGKALTVTLSALTVATLLAVWRGKWDPKRPRFARQMLATLVVAMLASFHNHIHGATLLLVPAVALMAGGQAPPIVRRLLTAGLYAPTVLFSVTYFPELVAFFFIGVMTTILGATVVSELKSVEEPGDTGREALFAGWKAGRGAKAVCRGG